MLDIRNLSCPDIVLYSLLPKLADGSFKVGIQGLDANRWTIDEVLYGLESYIHYTNVLRETLGVSTPPIDVWGGGQVSQVPRFLGEDPYENLSRLSEVASDQRLKCIYRGRQGFGFLPCSDDIQKAAISEAVHRGLHVFRTFDPMNDPRNLETTIGIIKDIRRKQLAEKKPTHQLVSAEALVFYVRPPESGMRVHPISSMCKYAVRLCDMGFNEIAIADYANQITERTIVDEVLTSVRSAMNDNGYADIPLNFFAQGCSSKIAFRALQSGADTVDVAIRGLSGTLSNPDMHSLIEYVFRLSGVQDPQRVLKNHPVIQALDNVVDCIGRAAARHIPYRIPEGEIDRKITARSRLAFNAVGALHSAISKNWDRLLERVTKSAMHGAVRAERQQLYLQMVLDETRELWIKGGQFNMVSPMGFFCSFQAEQLVRARISGYPLTPSLYTEEFRDVLKGRYGDNLGVLQNQCDMVLVNAFHLLAFLNVLKHASTDIIDFILNATGLDHILSSSSIEGKISIYTVENNTLAIERLGAVNPLLLASNLAKCEIPDDLREDLSFALSHKRFPPPQDDLSGGINVISEMLGVSPHSYPSHDYSRHMDEFTRLGMYAILFKVRESDPFCIVRSLIARRGIGWKKISSTVEHDIRPYDKLFVKEISDIATLTAKQQLIKRYVWHVKDRQHHEQRASDALTAINQKLDHVTQRLYEKINDITATTPVATAGNKQKSLSDILNHLVCSNLDNELRNLSLTPPLLWKITEVSE